jgi:dihydroxyacetone kinase
MTVLAVALRRIAADVIAAQDELNRLDRAAGDGDLGITMTAAANAITTALAEVGDSAPAGVMLRRCGAEIARRAPSTAGTLLAGAFLRVGAAAEETAHVAERPIEVIARLAAEAQRSIEQRGRARPGDKTMLDAVAPAAASLRSSADAGLAIADALDRAAEAASEGAASTRTMHARVGRAGWLPERSRDQVDAGAYLIALVIASGARHTRPLLLSAAPADVP